MMIYNGIIRPLNKITFDEWQKYHTYDSNKPTHY